MTPTGPDEDDIAIFREAVDDALRHEPKHVEPHFKRPRPRAYFSRLAQKDVMREAMTDPLDPDTLETGEELLYARPGIPHATFRRLRRGQYDIEAELDLHGHNSREAREAVGEFLYHVRQARMRCVRIIHGKGLGSRGSSPVIKNKLNHWLRQRDDVLAFASALPRDGGTGAVYVLLKRR